MIKLACIVIDLLIPSLMLFPYWQKKKKKKTKRNYTKASYVKNSKSEATTNQSQKGGQQNAASIKTGLYLGQGGHGSWPFENLLVIILYMNIIYNVLV